MKQLLFLFSILTLSVSSVWATTNDELINEINALDGTTLPSDQVSFQTFSSCEDMADTLTDFVKENFDTWSGPMPYWRGGGGPMPIDDMVSAEADASNGEKTATAPVASQDGGFSTTNIQVAGVDEPEILKSDGDYLYYYDQRVQKVFIIRTPFDVSAKTIALDNAQIVSILSIPTSMSAVQLFLHDDQLIVLGQRWSNSVTPTIIDTSSKSTIAIFDVSDRTDPKLMKFSDLDGMYQDARLVGDKLYVVSQLGINFRRYPTYYKTAEDVVIEVDDLMPKVVDVSYTTTDQEKNLLLNGKKYPYHLSVDQADCTQTHYVLPTKETIKNTGLSPQFTIIRAIDLDDTKSKIATTTAFGSTQTIHLTADSLYLANSFWIANGIGRCPAGMACIRGGGGESKTLLHKFDLLDTKISYVDSAILPGSPLTQWSMSEDAGGNFSILTSTWSPQQATHLITLDPSLDTLGTLLDIEPGEQFKASRYIGDKLYLVTFEQIDPLFVIDLADLKNPKIVGELKIPGYSTYLHPYAPASAGVQRLIGVGYDTVINQRGGTQNGGVKVDMYKVDYTQKDSEGNISVSQEASKVFGGQGSDSETLQNPRLFVRNPSSKILTMPMVLQQVTKGKQCTSTIDEFGNKINEQCRDNDIYKTTFAGIKGLSIREDSIDEAFGYDYTDLLKQDTQTYGSRDGQVYPRQLQNLQMRVGYVGDAAYSINNLFTHFFLPNMTAQEKFISLDKSIVMK